MRSTMMAPLSVKHLLERGRQFFGKHEIISRLPDKSIARTSYGALYDRARRLAAALVDAGVKPGEPVGTLMWNSSWHLEAYFGIPAAKSVGELQVAARSSPAATTIRRQMKRKGLRKTVVPHRQCRLDRR